MEIITIDRQLKRFWLADEEKGWLSAVGNVRIRGQNYNVERRI